MPNAPAARVTDQVQHTEAKLLRRIGMGLGALAGIGIGALLVVVSGAVEVLSAGTLTPVAALGVYVGAALVVGGTAAATGAAVSNSAADVGKRHMEKEGPILTGVTTIHIGPEHHVAAHAGSKVACKRHKHNAPDDVELVAQGSSTVLLGPGRDPAARVGDLGTCKFSIGQGCPTVIIGGKTATRYKIVDGDDPEKALFNKIGEYGGYAALLGGALIAIPVAAVGGGILTGLKAGAVVLGKGVAISQGVGWLVNQIPNEELRDHVNTVVALVLPFVGHDEGVTKEAPTGGETPSGGGETPGGGGETPGGGGETPGGGGETPGGGGETPGGGEPPAPANDNVPGGGRPAEPANDNVPGEGRPPEPASDNTPASDNAAPNGETAQQIGSHEGGAPGEAPPDDASSSGSTETPPKSTSEEAAPDEETEKSPDEETDPTTDQAAKDKAFQERAAAKAKTVRDGLHEDNQGRNIAVSEYTPEPGSTAEPGAGDYDPSVSGKKSPAYADPADGPRTNPTQKGTGELADQTHPIEGGGEKGNEHGGDRSTDSEVKLMEAFKKDLDANPNMRGTLDIFSDPNKPCGSCQDVARWFNSQAGARGRVRIHSADGGVFDEGGRITELPPDYTGRKTTPVTPGDPTIQAGPHPGGAEGTAPADEAGGAAEPASEKASDTAAEGDPTLQTSKNPGGRVNPGEDDGASQENDEASGKTEQSGEPTDDKPTDDKPTDDKPTDDKSADDKSADKKYVVSFFNESGAGYKQNPGATLGRPGGSSWVMPLEDAAGIGSAADAARETGYAPSVLDAAQKGQDVYLLATPSEGMPLRLPTAADAAGNPNWLPGGNTAIRVGDQFFVNPTHEFVTPGEQLVPPGSVLTKILPDGTWAWPPINVFREPGVPGPGLDP